MTLSELSDLVCTKVHRTDAQSVAEAKTYIRARYRMLWDSRPWRDAIGMITVPAESVSRITILPGIIDRVMSVRWGDSNTLLPADLGTIFSVDPAMFERSGEPATFSIISPSAVEVSPGGGKITVLSSDSNASFKVTVRGIRGTAEKSEVITTSGTGEVESVNEYDEILALAKASSNMDLTVKKSSGGEHVLFLESDESARQFQRLHFHVTPDSGRALLILFKRRFRPLNQDSDSTELVGIDNALVAAAIADMQEGQRQFGKAQMKMQEAGALASAVADMERHQSASVATLVPWDAAMSPEYPSDYDFP